MESPKLSPRVGPCAKGAKGPTRKQLMGSRGFVRGFFVHVPRCLYQSAAGGQCVVQSAAGGQCVVQECVVQEIKY